jgi:lipid-binding SYLF domain-containing protein
LETIMKLQSLVSLLALMALGMLAGCQHTTPQTEEGRDNRHDEVQTALREMNRADPDLQEFLNKSAGYAMFTDVGKAGFIVGAAVGNGEAYEGGQMIGYCKIIQASVGLQAGAQAFDELVVFQTREALRKFEDEKLEFGANASAIVLKAGAAKTASFRDGVAVFVSPKGGAMAELSVSGQKLQFEATREDRRADRRIDTHDNTGSTETRTETRTEERRTNP